MCVCEHFILCFPVSALTEEFKKFSELLFSTLCSCILNKYINIIVTFLKLLHLVCTSKYNSLKSSQFRYGNGFEIVLEKKGGKFRASLKEKDF